LLLLLLFLICVHERSLKEKNPIKKEPEKKKIKNKKIKKEKKIIKKGRIFS
jgi:hypothetical protein